MLDNISPLPFDPSDPRHSESYRRAIDKMTPIPYSYCYNPILEDPDVSIDIKFRVLNSQIEKQSSVLESAIRSLRAELSILKSKIATLEVENINLKGTVNELVQSRYFD